MKLDRLKAIALFREHWKYNALTGTSKKSDWILRNGFNSILSNCFLCEYNNQIQNYNWKDCSNCPIEWPFTQDGGSFTCMKSYYFKWFKATTSEERSRIAKIISELTGKPISH